MFCLIESCSSMIGKTSHKKWQIHGLLIYLCVALKKSSSKLVRFLFSCTSVLLQVATKQDTPLLLCAWAIVIVLTSDITTMIVTQWLTVLSLCLAFSNLCKCMTGKNLVLFSFFHYIVVFLLLFVRTCKRQHLSSFSTCFLWLAGTSSKETFHPLFHFRLWLCHEFFYYWHNLPLPPSADGALTRDMNFPDELLLLLLFYN